MLQPILGICFFGPFPVLPHSVTDIWMKLPTPLLTLIFATLMLGRPLPQAKKLWKIGEIGG